METIEEKERQRETKKILGALEKIADANKEAAKAAKEAEEKKAAEEAAKAKANK